MYSSQYKKNRQGETPAASLAQRLEAWMHRQVANDLLENIDTKNVTLELGAGTLNQLHYEPSVTSYDIVEPFSALHQDSAHAHRIRDVFSDIAEIPLAAAYDRITSIAALEHICNLPEVIARSGLLLNAGGAFRASIPNEGSLLWTLGWRLTTGLEFRLMHGLDYGLLMKHEHVNTANDIEDVLRYFFDNIRCKAFGLSKSISLYRYYECRNPNLSKCSEYQVSLSGNNS